MMRMHINISIILTSAVLLCVFIPGYYGQQYPSNRLSQTNPYSSANNGQYNLFQQLRLLFQRMFPPVNRPWWQFGGFQSHGWPRPQTPSPRPAVPALAVRLGLRTWFKLASQAGLVRPLSNSGPFTLLAPTDAAFSEALTPEVLADLNTNTDKLATVLKYHILPSTVFTPALKNEQVLLSAQGSPVRMNHYPHTDALTAQCALLEPRLLDRRARNGVVHVLSGVMSLPVGDLMEAVSSTQGLGTLAFALDSTGLADTLRGVGPFTLFAPSDDAFNMVPAAALSAMMSNATTLSHVLAYHVVRGTHCRAGLKGGVVSMGGASLQVSAGSEFTVNAAAVTSADVSVTNGVMHVIDQVLVPPELAGHVTQLLARAR